MFRARRVLGPVLCLLACPTFLSAQGGGLVDLPGRSTLVRYNPGSLSRAAQVQAWLQAMADATQKWSRRPTPLTAIVIDREQWQSLRLTQPYGVPAVSGARQLALPAFGDAGTVETWRALLDGRLPAVDREPSQGSMEEAASLIATDFLGRLQVARQLVETTGLRPREPWVSEVVAHTLVLMAAAGSQPGLRAELGHFYSQLADGTSEELDSYQAGLSFAAWLGFQARFFRAAEVIVDATPRNPVKALTKLARPGGGVLDGTALRSGYPGIAATLAPPQGTHSVEPVF